MYKSGVPHQPQAQHLEFKVCKSSDFEIRGAQSVKDFTLGAHGLQGF